MFLINYTQINIPRQVVTMEFPGMESQDTYVFVAPELNE